MKINVNLHAKTSSQLSSDFQRFFHIFTSFWARKYIPKSLKNRFWKPLASIWHRFGAARSNLGGLGLARARFVVDLSSILAIFLNGSSVVFANNRSMNKMHELLHSTSNFCFHMESFSLPSGAAGCAPRIRRLPTGVHGVLNTRPYPQLPYMNITYIQKYSSVAFLEIEACWAPPIL